MVIDGQPGVELLQRMQELHQETLEQTKGTSTFSVDAPSSTDATSPTSEVSALRERIEVEATKALRGDYASDSEIRSAVIDLILDERLGEQVTPAQRRKVGKKLKEDLVDDPGFVRQVDDMLLLAARELARRP